MLSYDDAIARILAQISPSTPVSVPILQSLGHTLAEDIHTQSPLPPFDNSAMDGYAVVGADAGNASVETPVALALLDTIAAGGDVAVRVTPGHAAPIMTGAPMPAGADTVVPVEDTKRVGDGVWVLEGAAPGQFVRKAGEDAPAGTLVVEKGSAIRAAEVGMFAAAGRAAALVYRRPRVGVISTGDELAEPGAVLGAAQIYNSNSYAVAAQVLEAGAEVAVRVHARDTFSDLRAAFDACADCDVILTTGGVSVGEFDFVKAVVEERGSVEFWRVAIRPGKPFVFGRCGQALLFGLPGNPVSAMVTFELFVRPALRQLLGAANPMRKIETAVLTEDVAHETGRRDFQRAVVTESVDELRVRATGRQGSGMLRSMVLANALMIVPEEVAGVQSGDTISVIRLSS
ncbi:molybdopterin molybdenumtransferase MoeA [Capsulimonas corticalis]|uniref:Molybdopterin molybdenumtransferase n=1 Tax=Capsulimonas corticalis TaxID=2219043 RepID=A0A9N7L8E0_9BACT|nr:gephyrin-like molybdotransferase Glp [Capsulimonas corticalis]BDI32219.1 molybdopterin molybdenumtransferase MoeA [Capsulimonas corticalis]